MTQKGYDVPAEFLPDEKRHRRQLGQAAQSAMAGKINAVTQITLTHGSTTTALIDSRVGANTFIGFSPRTANAVTALISGLYVSAKVNGQATLTHASSANTDQTFDILLIG